VLREHRRQQAEERHAAGSAWADNGGLVFTSRWGEPLYPDTVSALMGKLISQHNKSATSPAAALPHARLHNLRHLHATTLLLAGVPVHVVAARLGHADPAHRKRSRMAGGRCGGEVLANRSAPDPPSGWPLAGFSPVTSAVPMRSFCVPRPVGPRALACFARVGRGSPPGNDIGCWIGAAKIMICGGRQFA
jgi:integrase-like protein